MSQVRRNLLLLSAGRRVALSRLLQGSAQRFGAELYCADMAPELSAACQENGRSVRLSRVSAPSFREELLEICAQYEIGVVIPTIDTELEILAMMRPALAAAGTVAVVSDLELIQVSRDKRKSAEYFAQFALNSPTVYDPNAIKFPAIAKPFDGSLSRDVSILRGPEDLTRKIRTIPNIMFAAYLEHAHHEEFTVDAYYDRHSELKCVVPRLRLEVRGGEVVKGRAIKNDLVGFLFSRLAKIPGARGCLTFQFFRHRDTEDVWLIELNPRFGGGYPLTAAAGAPYHDWLVREYLEDETIAKLVNWQDGKTMLRFDDAVFLDG